VRLFTYTIIIIFTIFVFGSLCYAASKDEIVLTTYYPAPHGNYTELRSESIILSPQSGDPTTWADGNEGEFMYSDSKNAFFYFYDDGTASGWRHIKEGTGGATVGTIECVNSDPIAGPQNAWSDYASCPSVPAGETPYTAIGLARVDLQGTGVNVFVDDFLCDNNGCKVFCRATPCSQIRTRCCRIR